MCFACGIKNENWHDSETLVLGADKSKAACKPPIYTYWLTYPGTQEEVEVKHSTKWEHLPRLFSFSHAHIEARLIPDCEAWDVGGGTVVDESRDFLRPMLYINRTAVTARHHGGDITRWFMGSTIRNSICL